MGINELLKILKPATFEKHISDFKNKIIAVDMMAWLYRGAYASAVDIGQGKKSDLYLNFPIKMLALLHSHDIECIAVFDGKKISAKLAVEQLRNENKTKNLENAKKFQIVGKDEESAGMYRRALKIKSRMINTLIEVLKKLNVRVIIAPYEADSQISFLCKTGIADLAISEDSDLIPFGVNKVIYKLDSTGNCSYIDMEAFRAGSVGSDSATKSIRKLFSNKIQLVEFCVLMGCDYLSSIKGFGYKSAISMFESYEKLDTILHHMKFMDKFKNKIPNNYSDEAKKCFVLFFMQTVFNPLENKLQPLTDREIYHDTDSREDILIKTRLNHIMNSNKIEWDQYLGIQFDKYNEYCIGKLDVKTMEFEKKLESDEIIHKYVNRLKFMFNKKKMCENSTVVKSNLNEDINDKAVNRMINDEDDLEIQDFLIKVANREKMNSLNFIKFNPNSNLNSNPNQNINENEVDSILKICQTLSNENMYDSNLNSIKNNDSNITYTPKKENFNISDSKIFTPTRSKLNLNKEKPIKDLFDLIKKENELDISNSNKKKEFLGSISPNFNKTLSPYKTLYNSPSPLKTSSRCLFTESGSKQNELNPNIYIKKKQENEENDIPMGSKHSSDTFKNFQNSFISRKRFKDN